MKKQHRPHNAPTKRHQLRLQRSEVKVLTQPQVEAAAGAAETQKQTKWFCNGGCGGGGE